MTITNATVSDALNKYRAALWELGNAARKNMTDDRLMPLVETMTNVVTELATAAHFKDTLAEIAESAALENDIPDRTNVTPGLSKTDIRSLIARNAELFESDAERHKALAGLLIAVGWRDAAEAYLASSAQHTKSAAALRAAVAKAKAE